MKRAELIGSLVGFIGCPLPANVYGQFSIMENPGTAQTEKTPAGYIFHVAIVGAPDIWRRIQIRADWTLWELHEAIYSAFDRIDDHMFCFYLPKPGSRGRAAIRDAVEYAHPYTVEDAPKFGHGPPLCAHDGVLAEIGLKPRRRLYYLWDFGDEWWHTVKVEQVLDSIPNRLQAMVVEKHGKSPNEFKEWPPGRP